MQSVHDLFMQVILVLVQVVVQQTLSHDVLDLGALVQGGHGSWKIICTLRMTSRSSSLEILPLIFWPLKKMSPPEVG